MFKKFDFKRALRSRKLLVTGLIIVALLIGLVGGMSVAAHSSHGSALPPSHPVASVSAGKATAAMSVAANPATTVSNAQTTGNTTSTTKTNHSSAPAHTTTTQTTAPAAPAQPAQPTITFSGEGCYVTATGTPGLILTGAIHDALNKKGGPLGPNEGIAIPSSGTVTEGVVAGVGIDEDLTVIDAVLSDAQGNVVLTQTGAITSQSCSG